MSETQPTITLNNGVELPALGFGVFQTPADVTQASVEEALRVGYRLVDTAAAYIALYMLHQPLPQAFDTTVDALRALDRLLEDGRVRAIGIANFGPTHLE